MHRRAEIMLSAQARISFTTYKTMQSSTSPLSIYAGFASQMATNKKGAIRPCKSYSKPNEINNSFSMTRSFVYRQDGFELSYIFLRLYHYMHHVARLNSVFCLAGLPSGLPGAGLTALNLPGAGLTALNLPHRTCCSELT